MRFYSRYVFVPLSAQGIVSGTAANTIAAFVSAASGSPVIVGTAADTIAAFVSAASGSPVVAGTAADIIAAFISSASGSPVVNGTAADTIAAFISVASGTAGGSTAQGTGNGGPVVDFRRMRRRVRKIERSQGEERRAELERLRRTLQRAYDGVPLDDLPPELAAIVQPANVDLPQAVLVVDWGAFLNDLAAVRAFIDAMQAAADEEDAIEALLLAA